MALALVEPTAGGDGVYYLKAATQGPDLYRPPLYPLFLSLFQPWGLAYAANSAVTIIASILVLRATGSFWAAALVACCPFLIIYEYRVLSETLLIGLLMTGWVLIDRGRPVWAGLCLGLAMLTHDIVLLLPLFALPMGWRFGKGRQFAIVAAIAYLTILPWAALNYVNHGKLTLSEGRFGFSLWVGTWEKNGDWLVDGIRGDRLPDYAFRSPEERVGLIKALEAHDDGPFLQAAIDRIATNPLQTAQTWATRYSRLWIGTRTDQSSLRLLPGSTLWKAFKSTAWGLNLVLLVAGIWAIIRSRQWLWAIPPVYFASIYVPFHNVESRYSLPALVVMLIPLGYLLSARERRADAMPLKTRQPAA